MSGGAEPIALRAMTLSDIPEGLRLSRAAGWNQREEDWRFLLEGNPGRFVLASSGARVVGTGGAVCYGRDLAWVCMILVDPEQRKHGIGTRIVEGVLERLDDMRVVGLDATPFGQRVYERLGFEETGRLLRMEAPAVRGEDEGSRARPLVDADLRAVLAWDREVFGADRSALLRWAAGRAPAFCVEEGGTLAGYCLGRRGSRSRQIGPVVARDAETAAALVFASLTAEPETVVVDAAADRRDFLAHLEELGFTVQRPLVRMFRGARPVGRPDLQFAIFGPEFA